MGSEAGLFPVRELDRVLGLTRLATAMLQDNRTGANIQHSTAALLRQSIYSRLAGYEDTNDAERLAVDPVKAYSAFGEDSSPSSVPNLTKS